MDAFLASSVAIPLFGEALKAGLTRWFRRRRPDRVDGCPRCGRESLDRGLTGREQTGEGADAPLTVTVVLGVRTIGARLTLGPVEAFRTRPPVRCRDCGYRWPR